MQDWQLQAMKENEDAEAWEKSCAGYENEEHLKEAVKYMGIACEELGKVENILCGIAEDLDGTPDGDRIESVRSDIDKIWCSVRSLHHEFERRI